MPIGVLSSYLEQQRKRKIKFASLSILSLQPYIYSQIALSRVQFTLKIALYSVQFHI